MTNANGVVQAVKPWADPQAIAQPAKTASDVGVLKTFTQLTQHHQGNKLTRAHPNQFGHHRQQKRGDHIV